MSLSLSATDRRDLNVLFARLFQLTGFTYGITQAGANLGEIIAAGLSDLSSLGSTEAGYGASLIGVRDAGSYFTATNLEEVLAELAVSASGASTAVQAVDLASTANAKGASLVGIEDSNNNITATTVEGALAEIASNVSGLTVSLASTNANLPSSQSASTTSNESVTVDVAALSIGDSLGQLDLWVTGRVNSGAFVGQLNTKHVNLHLTGQSGSPYAAIAYTDTLASHRGDDISDSDITWAVRSVAGPTSAKGIRVTITGSADNPMRWLVQSSIGHRS